MKVFKFIVFTATFSLALFGSVSLAAAAAYTPFGDAELTAGYNSPFAYQLRSDTTPGWGGVDFAVEAGRTFGTYTTLSVDYKFTANTCGGGSPRFVFEVTEPGTSNKSYIQSYIGDYPNYTDCQQGVWLNSGNLLGTEKYFDAPGGGYYDTYNDVIAAYGTFEVTGLWIVADGAWAFTSGEQTVLVDNAVVNDTTFTFGAASCTPTGFWRDGINLTAAVINQDVSGTLDATGCNIGVYYDSNHNVTDAEIFGANYFGVVVRGAAADVTHSDIHDIGETPLNGSQHGIGIYYATVDNGSSAAQPVCANSGSTTGTISTTTVSKYQKGGISANCGGTAVAINNNTVTGEGAISYIAQNGIQISRGATANVIGNTVSGNNYTPEAWVACGLLFYQADGVKQSKNVFFGNEVNVCNAGRGGGKFNP